MNYKDAYYKLFNSMTDIIQKIEEIQVECEEICIGIEETYKKEKDNVDNIVSIC